MNAKHQKGMVLILTFMILIAMISIVGTYIFTTSVVTKSTGFGEVGTKAFWLAEAGLAKATWNLMTPTGDGGQGENWTTLGTTENLGTGSYSIVVDRYDFSLSDNGASASDNPVQTTASINAAKAIDGNNATYWESKEKPQNPDPQDLMIAFPYPLTINKARFLSPSSNNRPRDYEWAVSADNSSYTTVVTQTNSGNTDVTDAFSAQSNVNYLRLRVTKSGNPAQNVRIATLEVIGSKITSTGTISNPTISRTLTLTLVADDGSPENQVAYYEPDWSD